jgi:hypothetical protein
VELEIPEVLGLGAEVVEAAALEETIDIGDESAGCLGGRVSSTTSDTASSECPLGLSLKPISPRFVGNGPACGLGSCGTDKDDEEEAISTSNERAGKEATCARQDGDYCRVVTIKEVTIIQHLPRSSLFSIAQVMSLAYSSTE